MSFRLRHDLRDSGTDLKRVPSVAPLVSGMCCRPFRSAVPIRSFCLRVFAFPFGAPRCGVSLGPVIRPCMGTVFCTTRLYHTAERKVNGPAGFWTGRCRLPGCFPGKPASVSPEPSSSGTPENNRIENSRRPCTGRLLTPDTRSFLRYQIIRARPRCTGPSR